MTLKRTALSVLIISSLSATALAEDTSQIEQIIVKGTKQNQSLISTPDSVSVLDRLTITQSGISALRDLDDMLPNVSISQIGQIGGSYISIRGIESNPFVVNRAAVYVDGIPYREPDNINIRQAQQIEVLKGPQSALYGANADAGIIVVNTVTPTSEAGVTLFSNLERFSNGHSVKAGLSASGELLNDFFSTLEIEKQQGDSYVKNAGATTNASGEIDNLYLYSRSRYYLPANLGVLNLNMRVTRQNSPGLYEQEFAPLDTQLYNTTFASLHNNGQLLGPYTLLHDAPKNTEEDEWSAGLAYQTDIGTVTVDAALAYRESEEDGYGNDLDLTLAPFAAGGSRATRDYTNAEIRISQQTNDHLNWFTGIAYYRQNKSQNLYTLAGSGTLKDYQAAPTQTSSLSNLAAFGLLKYQPGRDITLQAGLRYEESEASVSQQAGSLVLGPLVLDYVAVEEDKDSEIWLPQLAVSWQPTVRHNIYVSAAKGYLPGGYNLVAADKGDSIAAQYGPYDEENLWSYELGYKTASIDNNMMFSGAIFYIDASSWQEVSLLTAPDGTVLSTVLITSDAAITSKGAEMEMSYNLTNALKLKLGAGYVNAQYDRNDYAAGISYAGNKVKMIPEWDTSVTATYEWQSGWFLRGQWRLLGKTALTADNAVFRPTTHLVDLALGYQGDKWQARLFAENLGDKRYAAGQAYQNFMLGFDRNYYAPLSPPRVVGLDFTLTL